VLHETGKFRRSQDVLPPQLGKARAQITIVFRPD
jgi:hypothetical protein